MIAQDRIPVMREKLMSALAPTSLTITDDSHKHVGHAGARDGRGHFTVEMVSEAFAGKRSLERHRMIYAALGDLMTSDIHALAIKARAPGEM